MYVHYRRDSDRVLETARFVRQTLERRQASATARRDQLHDGAASVSQKPSFSISDIEASDDDGYVATDTSDAENSVMQLAHQRSPGVRTELTAKHL
jgi:hypothetical protein